MPEQHVFVPNAAAVRQAGHVLRNGDWRLPRDGEATITFHPSYCHMQPWVLAALAAWALQFRNLGGRIMVENAKKAAYAWRFGLADYLGIDPPVSIQEHEEAGRFVALRTIRSSDDLADLLATLVTLLHLSSEPEHAKAVLYVVSEMVRNSLEHSEAYDGAVVAAQLYAGPRTNRRFVSIGVADTGVGVRKTISRNYVVTSHADAVLRAIEPGVTGAVQGKWGSSDNAGAGLFITRRLSAATRGYFALASGDGLYRSSLAARPPRDDQLLVPSRFFPGTVVCVEVGLDQEADFSSILDLARQAFGGKMQARRALLSERVRFG